MKAATSDCGRAKSPVTSPASADDAAGGRGRTGTSGGGISERRGSGGVASAAGGGEAPGWTTRSLNADRRAATKPACGCIEVTRPASARPASPGAGRAPAAAPGACTRSPKPGLGFDRPAAVRPVGAVPWAQCGLDEGLEERGDERLQFVHRGYRGPGGGCWVGSGGVMPLPIAPRISVSALMLLSL